MQGGGWKERGRENCRVVEFMLGYDAVCCSFGVYHLVVCGLEDGTCGRIYITLHSASFACVKEGVYAILILIDMEDFEMTMGGTCCTYVLVLVRQHELSDHSDPLGNSRAIHRVLGAFLWKGRQAAEMAKSAGDLRAIAVSFRSWKLCVCR